MDKWIIRASLCYDKGSIRKNNEDAYYFNGKYASLSKMDKGAFLTRETSAAGSLWAVCDGMGGQSNGEKASYTAVSGMPGLQEHLCGRNFEKIIQNWVNQANRAVSSQADGGGTTLVMLYCSDDYIQTAHVGDSRIYRYHDGQLIRMTKDHSKVEMLLNTKMITEEEAKNHPQKNVVTRYLGMDSEYVCDATVGNKIPFCDGDRFLLCSDGISDMITDEEIASVLADQNPVGDCVKKLQDAVFAAGAMDNLTAILLEFAALDQMDTVSVSRDYRLTGNEPTLREEKKAQQVRVKVRNDQPVECQVDIQISKQQ